MKPPLQLEKRYELEQSPLFKLSSKRKLAELLRIDLAELGSAKLPNLISQYRIFIEPNSARFITEPVRDLLAVHKRLMKLLIRIAPRDYVHSATKKRSYRTNAEQHRECKNVVKIDIKKFFPSVKFCYVHNFFANVMCCSKDIATILAKLCTVKTHKHGVHLPTGSCISPILSFLVNRDLFDRIHNMCSEQGCVFTLYVDDVTVSGDNATRALLSKIAAEIFKSGYGYHKIKTFYGRPAEVTGIVVHGGKLALPYVRQKKIRDVSEALALATGPLREKLLASLVGRLSEAEQIDPSYRKQRTEVLRRYSSEWKGVVEQRIAKAKSLAFKRQRKRI
ncbi:reverse transcriptase family protein [Telluria sp. B2]